MSDFLTRPLDHTITPRTQRLTPEMYGCAIQTFPRRANWRSWSLALAGLFIVLATWVLAS